MPERFITAIIMVMVFFLPDSTGAADFMIIQNKEVKVQFEKPLRSSALEVIKLYPIVKSELEHTFQTPIDFQPTIRLIQKRKTFQKAVGSSHAIAVALQGYDLIIIDNSKMNVHPFTLEATLKHELCHLFLRHLVKGGDLPRWFNEGLSQWVSGVLTEILIGENNDILKQAALSNRYIPLRSLSVSFPGDYTKLQLAYQQSRSIVEYMVKEYGEDGVMQVVARLGNGSDMNSSVLEALSLSLEELEKKWHGHLRKKYTWFTYLSAHLYEILFSFAALALTYGFIKVMLRKRAYKDEEEEGDDPQDHFSDS